MTVEMKIAALTPWYGSKRGMVGDIVRASGVVPAELEFFVDGMHGSGAMLLGLREMGMTCPAVANDLNWLMYNLVAVVAHQSGCERLMEWLAWVPMHERVFQNACEELVRNDDVESRHANSVRLAAAYLIATWMGRNGEAGTDKPWMEWARGFCVRWSATGGDPAVRWQSVKDSIPAWYRHLCHKTTFTCDTVFETLRCVKDEPGTWVYLDPPYLRETRGNTAYAVEFEDATGTFREDEDHHAMLARAAGAIRRATVSVSYYAHERLKRLYPEAEGWVHHDLSRNKASAQASEGAKGSKSPEVLIVRRGGAS